MDREPPVWRSSERYGYVETLIAPQVAWEWLRRNDGYRRNYAELTNTTESDAEAFDAFRGKWGLRFPDCARRRREPDAAGLVAA